MNFGSDPVHILDTSWS